MITRPLPLLLVIDHAQATADLNVASLTEQGYTVDAVTTRQETLARLSARGSDAYRLVLSNSFAGPGDDPFAWLDALRQYTPAPVVIISAYPEQQFSGWRERGFAGFLGKPFDLDTLTALVVSLGGEPGA